MNDVPDHVWMREARKALGLSVKEFAAMIETDEQTVRRMEFQPTVSTYRYPATRMPRLIEAYLAGWRPPDWPGTK